MIKLDGPTVLINRSRLLFCGSAIDRNRVGKASSEKALANAVTGRAGRAVLCRIDQRHSQWEFLQLRLENRSHSCGKVGAGTPTKIGIDKSRELSGIYKIVELLRHRCSRNGSSLTKSMSFKSGIEKGLIVDDRTTYRATELVANQVVT